MKIKELEGEQNKQKKIQKITTYTERFNTYIHSPAVCFWIPL